MADPIDDERRDAGKFYSVSSGIPIRTTRDVLQYMTTGDGSLTGPVTDKDRAQIKSEDLLEIISTGINNIVLTLKLRLGQNFTENNENAKLITDRLNQIKTDITTQIRDNLYVNDPNAINIDPDTNILTPGAEFLPNGVTADQINLINDRDFRNLDSDEPELGNVVEGIIPASEDLNVANGNQVNIDIINLRLKNCQKLEFLYLKKHDEIMKIFAFTMNLFDKYKYAIKIILLL